MKSWKHDKKDSDSMSELNHCGLPWCQQNKSFANKFECHYKILCTHKLNKKGKNNE